jgi:hypothetical protein
LKIAAGIVTYADALSLSRTLETITSEIDQSIVVHVQYPGFRLQEPSRSLDDTRKVCAAFPHTKIVDLTPCSEIEARQTYLNEATNFDFLLVIDSDEYITKIEPKDRGLFRQNCQKVIDDQEQEGFYIYDIMFGGDAWQSGPRPRLFKEPSKIKYYKKHYWWILPNGKLMKGNSDSVKVIDGIEIVNDNKLRNPGREMAKLYYQQWLLEQESQYVV